MSYPPDPEYIEPACAMTHDVNVTFTWNNYYIDEVGTAANGTAFTQFLAALNVAPGFAGRTNWRLPKISELQSIAIGEGVTTPAPGDSLAGANPTGQSMICVDDPCIDPDFAAVGGPTASGNYWSATTVSATPTDAWGFVHHYFYEGFDNVYAGIKQSDNYVRAVRTGSCGSSSKESGSSGG